MVFAIFYQAMQSMGSAN